MKAKIATLTIKTEDFELLSWLLQQVEELNTNRTGSTTDDWNLEIKDAISEETRARIVEVRDRLIADVDDPTLTQPLIGDPNG